MRDNPAQNGPDDNYFEEYKKRVYGRLSETDRKIIPLSWWDSVIRHYFNLGYSDERAVRAILETMER
jgi:hypothetical protein